MSYNLVSPHYTTTKAKSGGRERSRWRRWRRKSWRKRNDKMERTPLRGGGRGKLGGGLGWVRYREGSKWGV